MGITLVQTKTGQTVLNATALPLALASNTVTGDMIIVAITIDDNADDISSVTSTGSSFSKITSASGLTGDGFTYVSVWYAFNVTGETTPTITINKSTSVSIEAVLRHYLGVTTTTPLDKVASASGGTSASPSSAPSSGATVTLSQANELVVGISGSDYGGATYTLGSGYGNLVQIANTLNTSEMGTEDKTVAATTGVTAAFTISNATTWRCSVLTFLIAGTATPSGNLLLTTGF